MDDMVPKKYRVSYYERIYFFRQPKEFFLTSPEKKNPNYISYNKIPLQPGFANGFASHICEKTLKF